MPGIGMVYQHFKLVEAMTVAENIYLGHGGGLWLNWADDPRARCERWPTSTA